MNIIPSDNVSREEENPLKELAFKTALLCEAIDRIDEKIKSDIVLKNRLCYDEDVKFLLAIRGKLSALLRS